MKKSISIVLIIILITQILAILIPIKTYATSKEEEEEEGIKSCGDMMRSGKTFLEVGEDDAIDKENLAKVNRTIYNSFLTVAIGIAVIVGTYLGIKIMTGTIEEKAKTKEMMIPYIVGVVVIFSVFPIWSFVVEFGTDVVGDGKHVEQTNLGGFFENIDMIVQMDTYMYSHPNERSNVLYRLKEGEMVKFKAFVATGSGADKENWIKILYRSEIRICYRRWCFTA